jgi:PAS domain S-box-containing protein
MDEKSRNGRAVEQGLDKAEAESQLALKDRALAAAAEGITIADARLPDQPLIYVNEGFERLTGYRREEVLGRNCRFLQGPAPDVGTVDEIGRALAAERECTVEIQNFRKDGTPFWNRLSITPVRDESGAVTHFIGIQSDVTKRRRVEDALRRAKEKLEAVNRRMKAELETASKIQRALLPGELPDVGEASFSWVFEPCEELAGDTFNVIPLDDRRAGLFMLDVSGHGVPAALLSVAVHRWISERPGQSALYARDGEQPSGYRIATPKEVADSLNAAFAMDTTAPQYFTILYGILDVKTREFRFVSAGHPAPAHGPNGEPVRLLQTAGFPIGIVPEGNFTEQTVKLSPGDRLYLFTDGLTESPNREEEEFGADRLAQALEQTRHLPLRENMQATVEAANRWRQGAPSNDDLSLLGVELR